MSKKLTPKQSRETSEWVSKRNSNSAKEQKIDNKRKADASAYFKSST